MLPPILHLLWWHLAWISKCVSKGLPPTLSLTLDTQGRSPMPILPEPASLAGFEFCPPYQWPFRSLTGLANQSVALFGAQQ
jgi:hypothetical protein